MGPLATGLGLEIIAHPNIETHGRWQPGEIAATGSTATCIFALEEQASSEQDRGRDTGLHHERLDYNRNHRYVPGDSTSASLPFDFFQSR